MPIIRSIYWGAILLFCCLFAVGCQSKDSSPRHFRIVLDRPANPNHVPLYVGQALGYFREEGIFLEFQKPSSDQPLLQLDEGSADFVLASLPRVLRAVARKSSIDVVGKIIDKPLKGFVVLKSSGIKTLEDFNGHILGFDGAYSTIPSAEVLFDEKNIQLGCKLNVGHEATNELVSKKIDIVYGALSNLEPEYLRAMGHNTRFFLATDFGMPDYEEVVIAAHARMSRDKRLIASFQKALQRSIDFCSDKPQLAFEMYGNLLQNKSRTTMMWEEASWHKTVPVLVDSQQFSYESVKALADWLFDSGLIGTQVDFASHFKPDLQKKG